jgi:hypothetical protein
MNNLLVFTLAQFITFCIFLIIYFILMLYYPECWEGLPDTDLYTFFDAFYFTTATHTHTGYVNITPKTRQIRFLISIHMLIVFSLILLVIDYK